MAVGRDLRDLAEAVAVDRRYMPGCMTVACGRSLPTSLVVVTVGAPAHDVKDRRQIAEGFDARGNEGEEAESTLEECETVQV